MVRPLEGELFYPLAACIAADTQLTLAQKVVWAYLRFVESPDGPAVVGVRAIARACDVDRKTAERAIARLVDRRLLVRVRRGLMARSGAFGEAASYRTILPVRCVGVLPTSPRKGRPVYADASRGGMSTSQGQKADASVGKKCPLSKNKTLKKEERAADAAASPSVDQSDNDLERLVLYTFHGIATPKQRSAAVNAADEALRLGATCPLLAHAVRSRKAKEEKPWKRIEEAGKRTKNLVDRARKAWPDFRGTSLDELLTATAPGGLLYDTDRLKENRTLQLEIDTWRQQATCWPRGA
jgi:hypothetical protein